MIVFLFIFLYVVLRINTYLKNFTLDVILSFLLKKTDGNEILVPFLVRYR